MKRAIVLGAGMVGTTIARDLSRDFAVGVADRSTSSLARLDGIPVEKIETDLADPDAVRRVVADYDIVIDALSSTLGHQTLRAVIEAGRPCVDITFMEQDPTDLSRLAKERGVTAVMDCGVAPGMSNLFAGWAASRMDRCDALRLLVGGVPAVRTWPFEYKAPYAPSDVFEIYTRPARIVRNGETLVVDALSESELFEVPGVGTLEAFNTDGLRSLLHTLDVPNMVEKTLRYPGHAELMRVFRETGLFSETPVAIDGAEVRPLDVAKALLIPKWTLEEGEHELTILDMSATGVEDGVRVQRTALMVDRYDSETQTTSMARSTGYPAAIMARLIADGRFAQPGVHPPEIPGAQDGIWQTFVSELALRGVHYAEARNELASEDPAAQ